jgi:leucine-rich repeat kinase 1
MDGPEVFVAVYGDKNVGKSTFIVRSLGETVKQLDDQTHVGVVNICGRDIAVKIIENPELLATAILVVILFDLTKHETYVGLSEMLELTHSMCPKASIVIIGTKADLRKPHHVTTKEAEGFCHNYQNGKLPYYEIRKDPPEEIEVLFKEILARPLINLSILESPNVHESRQFAHETMKWAIENRSANVLTHLRELGYAIFEDLICAYNETVASYLIGEYPLKLIPKFELIKQPEFSLEIGDSELDESDEPTSIVDSRSSLNVTKTHLLQWTDISLYTIPLSLFSHFLPVKTVTHVDFSYNLLEAVPIELFLLPSLIFLNLSHNCISSLPSATQWCNTRLEMLDLSYNSFINDVSSPVLHTNKRFTSGLTSFCSQLWYVDFSHSKLSYCPMWLVMCSFLKHLDLSGNFISMLPTELGLLAHLHTLVIKDLPLTDPPSPIPSLSTQTILSYLQFKHKSAQSITSMRVVVVGPESSGKTSLIMRLKGESGQTTATKGLEVTEWKYKGEVLRRNQMTFDIWDFSGHSRYKYVYSCFQCSESLHIAVFNINTELSDMIQWLSDIQSFSSRRVPVLVVFTHMDMCPSRDAKETEKKKKLDWIKYNTAVNEKPDSSSAFTLLASTMSQTVKSLQDLPHDHRQSVTEKLQSMLENQETIGELIPLMPLIIGDPLFVSNVNNENISQLKKNLYRIANRSFRTNYPVLDHVGIEVPSVYIQIENLIRQLRGHLKSVKTEGEQKPFYRFSDLTSRLRRPLKQLDITCADFQAALRFFHERGVVYIHDLVRDGDNNSSPIVAINPQIVGFLLQRTVRSGEMHSEANVISGFLPNMHPAMIWGIDPVIADGLSISGITALQLMDFLMSIDLCAPLVPGACLIPSLLPILPVPGTVFSFENLEVRRVYLLGYLPSFFSSHLTSRILRAFAYHRLLQGEQPLTPVSPTTIPVRPTNPLVTPTGAKLYLWQKHFIYEDVDGSKLWVIVFEGGQLGPESTQYCGRVDVLVGATTQEKEAMFLKIITDEIDQLISEKYPSLLEDHHTPQLVDVLIPLSQKWLTSITPPSSTHQNSPPNLSPSSLRSSSSQGSEAIYRYTKQRAFSTCSFVDITNSLCSASGIQGTLMDALASIKTNTIRRPSSFDLLSGPQIAEEEEDVNSNDLGQFLVPAWECLQEAFKSSVFRLKEGNLNFRALMPDLLFADMPSHMIITELESHMVGVKIQESKGMLLRYYYNDKSIESPPKRYLGAKRMLSLKSNMIELQNHFNLLQSVSSCPYIMSPVGIHLNPPALALELAPHNSLRHYLDSGKTLKQNDIHQVALQVLAAMEFLQYKDLRYHYLTGDAVYIWLLDPITVKLSDIGLTHFSTKSCVLCSNLITTPVQMKKAKSNRFDLIMFGLFLYEITLNRRAYEGIFSLGSVILGLYHQKIKLSIEADTIHFWHLTKTTPIKACHTLCLQSIFNLCVGQADLNFHHLKDRLSLCAGEDTWAPLKLTLDAEALLLGNDQSTIYWASGSRGLVVGYINSSNGDLYSRILAQPPTPESGLFANRRGKPIPISVGHATAIDLCQATDQIWVGTENGLMGSVYIFNLPDMKNHHYIHLQDAVLSLKVLNKDTDENIKYQTLIGLANGTIILFLGKSQGKVLENPLQGPKKIITTHNRTPCLSIGISCKGDIWCACGNNFQVFDSSNLKSTCCYPLSGSDDAPQAKPDVILYMILSRQGVWSVTRRSTVLSLSDMNSGMLKASFNIKDVLKGDFNEITAVVIQGLAVWVGTRSGYILLLDGDSLENQRGTAALKGLQYCGEGRVKCIIPFATPGSLKVIL